MACARAGCWDSELRVNEAALMTSTALCAVRTIACTIVVLLAGAGATATAMPVDAEPTAPPMIASDKDDYAPGELVRLSGAGWQPAESVHIRVNDDAGSSWSRDVDVTADQDGNLSDSFDLPDWFVAEYSVRASGVSGSVALASFTDGNVKVAVVGGTAAITETLHTTAGCSGAIKTSPATVTIPPSDTVGVGSSESLRLDAPATANGGEGFVNWSKPSGSGLSFSPIAGTNGRSVCVAGFQSGSADIIATYAAATNAAPTVTAASPSVTVAEGQTATNTGSYSDTNAGDTVTLSASRGTVTRTGTSTGTWSWSFATTDGADQTGPVTITASDGKTGGTATTTFALNVSNVAPTVTLAASNPSSVNEGPAQQTYTYTISDPGADTVSAVTTSCGASGAKVPASDTNTNTSGSFKCIFADGPTTSIVSASATDSDNATGNLATQAVSIANVAPAVSAPGDQAADEGASKSFSLGSFTDPGPDSPWAVDVDWGDSSSDTTFDATATGSLGSRSHTYADGPASRTVTVKVTDRNGDSDATTFTVAVANVAPTADLGNSGPTAEGSPVT